MKTVYFRSVVYMITVFSIIALLVSSLYYTSIRSQVENEVTSNNSQILKQMASTYEVFLDSTIKAIMVSIEQESHSSFIDRNSQVDSSIYEKLDSLTQISNYIYSIYYFNQDTTNIYVSMGFSFEKESFYDKEWIDALQSDKDFYILPARKLLTLPSGEKEVIPIVMNFPLNALEHQYTYVVNLDVNQLFTYLIQSADLNTGRDFKIMDPSGMIFVTTNQPEQSFTNVLDYAYLHGEEMLSSTEGSFATEKDGNKVIVSYFTSPLYGWKYVSEVEYEAVSQGLLFPLKLIVLIVCISLIVSTLAAILVSRRLYGPIRDIIGMIGASNYPKESSNDEYELIKKHIHKYSYENQHLKETVKSNIPVVEKSFLYNLLVRNVYNEADIKEKMAYFQIPLCSNYTVITVEIDEFEKYINRFSMDDRVLWEYAIENIALEIIDRNGVGFFMSLEAARFALVYSVKNEMELSEAEKLAAKLALEFKNAIHAYLKLSMSVGIGRAKDQPGQLYKSYYEALTALKYAETFGSGEMAAFWECQGSGERVEYPYDLESQLMQSMTKGDAVLAKHTLTLIYDSLRASQSITSSQLHMFTFQLLIAINKLLLECDIPESEVLFDGHDFFSLCRQILQEKNEEGYLSVFNQIIDNTCVFILARKENASNLHVKKMVDYIEENYHQGISADSIADHIGLNRVYAGRLFKQNMNLNITDYINMVRIQKSVVLLKETNMKIMDICTAVGFNNTHYFIRIFKRIMNVTPGQYKEQLNDTTELL